MRRPVVPIWLLMLLLLGGSLGIGYGLWSTYRYPQIAAAETIRARLTEVSKRASDLRDARREVEIWRRQTRPLYYAVTPDSSSVGTRSPLDVRFVGVTVEEPNFAFAFELEAHESWNSQVRVSAVVPDRASGYERTLSLNLVASELYPLAVRLPLFDAEDDRLLTYQVTVASRDLEAKVITHLPSGGYSVRGDRVPSSEAEIEPNQVYRYYDAERLVAVEERDAAGTYLRATHYNLDRFASLLYREDYEQGCLKMIEVRDEIDGAHMRELVNAAGQVYLRQYFVNAPYSKPEVQEIDQDRDGRLEQQVFDLDADGLPDIILNDRDGDGIHEEVIEDFDRDGSFVPLGPGLTFFAFG